MYRLCVFAGTSEGRRLVELLAGRGAEITACVATDYGEAMLGEHPDARVVSGRMNADEMAAFLARERFDLCVDATHPYAAQATQNIFSTCARANVPCMRLLRPGGAGEDDGAFVPDAAACADFLKGTEGNILLTTGSKELPAFCADAALRERIYARVLPMAASLQICADCGVRPDRIIAMQGPFDEEMNLATLRAVNARWLVTKDTGSAGGYAAKLRAAQRAGARVVVIGRPVQREGLPLAEVLREIAARFGLAPLRKRVTLAGIGMGDADSQTQGLLRAVRDADCLIGAGRMLAAVDAAGKQRFQAVAPGDIARIVRESPHRSFTVLLSGDSGFYSGAKKLIAELNDAELTVLPGIGSLQYLCAKLRRSWEDVRAVSLHGRECDIVREVEENAAVFALVGGEGGAREALVRLRDAGFGACRAFVGERLGYSDERIHSAKVAELAEGEYDPLSVLLIENAECGKRSVTHGLPDEEFERGDVPMTKMEVRSVALSKLAPTRNAVVYDVGAGSGSVTVEAARLARNGRVYAIERKESALALTRRNVEKFRLTNVELVAGCAPEVMEELPPPTHVFIGGSAGNLRDIIRCAQQKNPGARFVVTAVTLETVAELIELGREFEYCDVAQISVSKPRKLGGHSLMTAQNPVFICTLQNHGGKRKC